MHNFLLFHTIDGPRAIHTFSNLLTPPANSLFLASFHYKLLEPHKYRPTSHSSVERGMGSVKRLEFGALPREGGWDYIYLNDDVQGSEGGR